MKLKAHYDPESLKAGGKPRCTHVEVIHTGASAEQNFDDQMIDDGLTEGWVTIGDGELVLKTDGEPLRYALTQRPGYFCKSTSEAIPITEKAWFKFRLGGDSSQSRPEALAWLAANGKAPDDYDISVTYRCVLNDEQHQQWRAVRDIAGNLVAAHTLQGA